MRTTTRTEGALLSIRVQPRAQRDEIVGWQDGTVRVRVAAPPIDGKANDAVIRLLADAFDVPRASIELVSGATGRDKRFRIARRSLDELRLLLDRRLAGPSR